MGNKLTAYLAENLTGFSQVDLADKTGIAQGSISRILRGAKPPSIESCIRLAWPMGAHPAAILELAGYSSVAFMLKDLFPMEPGAKRHEYDSSYSAKAADLHQRVERLLKRGMEQRLDHMIREVEQAWKNLQPPFVNLAQQAGANAALLVAGDEEARQEVLFRWECPEPMAAELLDKGRAKGWESYTSQEQDMTLTIFLRKPGPEWKPSSLNSGLGMLAAGVRALATQPQT